MLLQQPHMLIQTEEELRTRIPLPISFIAEKKTPILSDLDEGFIALSPFLCIATRGSDGAINVSAHGGKPGFVRILNGKTLLIPLYADRRIRDPQEDILTHSEIGLIFMIPGATETLRVNGQGTVIDNREHLGTFFPQEELPAMALLVEIIENYMQCPKALLRSQLWKPETHIAPSSLAHLEETPVPLTAFAENSLLFLEQASFMCLGTCDGKGGADISPRGDPPGAFKVLNNKTLLIGDRPGNRLVDSHRNVLQYPSVGLAFFIPGINLVLTVQGRAHLTTDNDVLELLTVQGKKPILGVWIDVETVFLSRSQALERANTWDEETYIDPKTLPTLVERIKSLLKAVGKEDLPMPLPIEQLAASSTEEALKRELY